MMTKSKEAEVLERSFDSTYWVAVLQWTLGYPALDYPATRLSGMGNHYILGVHNNVRKHVEFASSAIENVLFQLSRLFTYPDSQERWSGHRFSDNRGQLL